MSKITELTKCIVCDSPNIKPVWDLGEMYPSAFIDNISDTAKFTKTPFVINRCECGMCQLKYVAEYDSLFKDYFYRSSVNAQMVKSLKNIVESHLVAEQIQCASSEGRTPIWVDIGNNDGCMSQLAKTEYDLFMVGVDPALELNNAGNDVFINDYFMAEPVLKATEYKKADIVSAIACFYDLQDPHTFLKDVVSIMRDDGIFIVQLNDIWGKLKQNTVDDLVLEHVAYYSLEVLDNLFKMNGLEIFVHEYNYTNGSSLRVYAQKIGKGPYEISEHVRHEIDAQKPEMTDRGLSIWLSEIVVNLLLTRKFLEEEKSKGKKISLIGASTKGNTTLMLSGLNNKVIDSALEISPFKFDKYCLGSDIQIVDEKLAMTYSRPDILVGMVWHFKKGLLNSFAKYIEEGGIILFPFPRPHIVSKDGEKYLTNDSLNNSVDTMTFDFI